MFSEFWGKIISYLEFCTNQSTVRVQYRCLIGQELVFNSHIAFLMKLPEDVFHQEMGVNLRRWNYGI